MDTPNFTLVAFSVRKIDRGLWNTSARTDSNKPKEEEKGAATTPLLLKICEVEYTIVWQGALDDLMYFNT